MLRPVRGVLVTEGVQTGDGRFIVPDATTWADPPLPIAFIEDGDQHVEPREAPQVGNILSLTRTGGLIEFVGHVDDESDAGAELIRRMLAGAASNGARQFLSIDPDDWAYEIVDTTVDETGGSPETIVASAAGTGIVPALTAAAGDGEPVGVIVYEEGADSYVQRFTRLRIRGVTACAVPAFDGAYMELSDAVEEPAPVEDAPAEVVAEATIIVAAASDAPMRPPREWFDMPEPGGDLDPHDEHGLLVDQYTAAGEYIGQAVPLTITDDGQVFGHVAASWGQCHVGYLECVTPPPSNTNYAHYHVGATVCADGTTLATGALTVGCDHADEYMHAFAARDAYANSGMQWGAVRAVDGVMAPWVCGAIHPGYDEATLRLLRSTVFSGDWRRIGGALDAIAILSVNNPGYAIAREALAASAFTLVASSTGPRTYAVDGEVQTLIAATPAARCADCAKRAAAMHGESEVAELKRMMDLRTAHLLAPARDALLAKIRKPA